MARMQSLGTTFGRLSALANVFGGICLAAFFVLHPGGGDPPSVEAALAPVYGLEHTLGVIGMALLMLGLPSLAAGLALSNRLTPVACALAFVGAYLLGGVVYFDAYYLPAVAANAPGMLAADGALNTAPVVLANAIPGVVWGLGSILLAIIGLSRAALPRRSSGLVLLGAILINLPPQPLGPAPLWLNARPSQSTRKPGPGLAGCRNSGPPRTRGATVDGPRPVS
jgi:hypothetical protein